MHSVLLIYGLPPNRLRQKLTALNRCTRHNQAMQRMPKPPQINGVSNIDLH